MSKKTIVIYHKNCLDGFGAAWSAWKKLGDQAEYIAMAREDTPPQLIGADNIFFIDFTYPTPLTREFVQNNNHVVILDHHESEQNAIALGHEHIFDNNRSGAMIAWDYFHVSEKTPELIRYIQDNDLFTRRLPNNREIIAALSVEPLEFQRFSEIAKILDSEEGKQHFIEQGRVLLKAEEQAIQKLLSCAEPVLFEGYQTMAINTIVYYSQAAAAVYLKLGFLLGLAWSYRGNNLIHVSLRSDGQTVNCADIAKKYGGGGHAGAAGFIIEFNGSFPWKRLEEKTVKSITYDTGAPLTASR